MLINPTRLSIVIPTYGREQVLINTLEALHILPESAYEILVIDQTPVHEPEVHGRLEYWSEKKAIRWLKQAEPSIPKAMNRGALEAKGALLLFLDDDIVPDANLLKAHRQAHDAHRGDIIAGRVLQPWHGDDHETDTFTGTTAEVKEEFIGCNFSIQRETIAALGGFDENFKGAAYQYEREFADRLLVAGGTIWYEPTALIRHLHYQSGGTRSRGGHLTSWNPRHPVGAYYYLLISKRVTGRLRRVLARFVSSVKTRHHLRKPWYIPVTLCSEVMGFFWAVGLRLRGQKLLE